MRATILLVVVACDVDESPLSDTPEWYPLHLVGSAYGSPTSDNWGYLPCDVGRVPEILPKNTPMEIAKGSQIDVHPPILSGPQCYCDV